MSTDGQHAFLRPRRPPRHAPRRLRHAARLLPDRRALRSRARPHLARRVAVRRLHVRDPQARRLPHVRGGRHVGARHARRRRRRARVPQRLPPSRHAALPRRRRPRARHRVPVPQLDVLAAGRAPELPRHARRRGQVEARAEAAGDGGRRGPRLRLARRVPARFRALARGIRAGRPAAGLRAGEDRAG